MIVVVICKGNYTSEFIVLTIRAVSTARVVIQWEQRERVCGNNIEGNKKTSYTIGSTRPVFMPSWHHEKTCSTTLRVFCSSNTDGTF